MIAIIDYGLGNIASIKNMFKKIGVHEVVNTCDKETIFKADKIILPGVGAFDAGMEKLKNTGLIEVLNDRALKDRIPVLGICLGMQMLTKGSEEGILSGLGWVDAKTVKFKFSEQQNDIKIPHVGWNYVHVNKSYKLVNNLPEKPRYYFVHSYYVKCNNTQDILFSSNYGFEFTCGVQHENVMGVQFHPEKSHKYGFQLLKNFSEI